MKYTTKKWLSVLDHKLLDNNIKLQRDTAVSSANTGTHKKHALQNHLIVTALQRRALLSFWTGGD